MDLDGGTDVGSWCYLFYLLCGKCRWMLVIKVDVTAKSGIVRCV